MFAQIINLLRADGSIVVNKVLAKNIGLYEAIIYSELASKFIYYAEEDKLTEDGYFYYTNESMEKDITLTKFQQAKPIENLINLKLIRKVIRKGKGNEAPLRYFTLNPDTSIILKLLSDKSENKLQTLMDNGKLRNFTDENKETSPTKIKKLNTSNTNNNTNNNIKHTHTKNNVCEEISKEINIILGQEIGKPKLKTLIKNHGVENIKSYMSKWEQYREHAIGDQVSYFVFCVMNNKPVPTAPKTKQTTTTATYANFDQREYDDGEWEKFYANS